jgi:hypothetical protein
MPLAHVISRSHADPHSGKSIVNRDLICDSDPDRALAFVSGYAQPFERVAIDHVVMLSADVFDLIRNVDACCVEPPAKSAIQRDTDSDRTSREVWDE